MKDIIIGRITNLINMHNSNKQHISLVIAGHVDAGKSTFANCLLTNLGTIPIVNNIDKNIFTPSNDTNDTQYFYTHKYRYTIIDSPSHRDFVKNIITTSLTADVAVLMVPADHFITYQPIDKCENNDHVNNSDNANDTKISTNEIGGQTRQHALVLHLLGIRQLIICVNKMDAIGYSESIFNLIKTGIINMLSDVGWSDVLDNIAILPISTLHNDNLLNISNNMQWFNGVYVKTISKQIIQLKTVLDAFDQYVQPPIYNINVPVRMPISGVHIIKGVGNIITGRIDQGHIRPGHDVSFLPNHNSIVTCCGKVSSVEMHHQPVCNAGAGDSVALNISGLNDNYKPRVGDVLVLSSDTSLKIANRIYIRCRSLTYNINQITVGNTLLAYVRTATSIARIVEVIDANIYHDMKILIELQTPLAIDIFEKCEGLGRIALFDGNDAAIIGYITSIE